MATLTRCAWCEGDELYQSYHDEEWGVPEVSHQGLFERLILEGMQAGLSWITVLRKRDRMQALFFGFDVALLADAGEADVASWLSDAGIIRHRGKLEAMITNARLAREHPDFAAWLWQFAPSKPNLRTRLANVPSETEQSKAMSKALKKAGYRFVGPTICYAFMQSVGMVNDHVVDCWRHAPCAALTRGLPGVKG